MLKHRIRHLPVVDENGRATGYLSDVEVFRFGGPTGEDMELWVPFQHGEVPDTAADVQLPIETRIGPNDPITVTLRKLVQGAQDFAVVEDDDGELMGIVTEHDGLRVAVEALEQSELAIEMEATTPTVVARKSDPAAQILSNLQSRGIRHIAVVDEFEVCVGVVSTGDLLADSVMHQPELTIGDVMRPRKPITISPRQRLGDAAATMMQNHVGCLPVVDEVEKPQGILTRTDLIQAAVAALEERAMFGAEA